MNKNEFIKHIAETKNITQKEANNIIDTFIEGVTSALQKSNKISLVGFGNFNISNIPERPGRNVKTKEIIIIPAHKRPKFKAGQKLKRAVNK